MKKQRHGKAIRAKKASIVEDLNGVFKSPVVVVARYTGMTVAEMGTLRGRVREAGASFRVTKNLLAKRALKDSERSGLSELFTGPTAVSWSEDPIAAPKALSRFAKENEKLVIIGGVMGATLLTAEQVKALAALPSIDELRGRIVGLLQAPATKLAQLLKAPGGQLARLLSAHAEKQRDAA